MKCGICGKEFLNDQFDEYAAHVNQCAYETGLKKKTDEMKKIQEELEEVKRAKTVYEGLRDSFKEKYPDIYKINFKDELDNCGCGDCHACDDDYDGDDYDPYDDEDYNDNYEEDDNNLDCDTKNGNNKNRNNHTYNMYSPWKTERKPIEPKRLKDEEIDEFVNELLDDINDWLGLRYKRR